MKHEKLFDLTLVGGNMSMFQIRTKNPHDKSELEVINDAIALANGSWFHVGTDYQNLSAYKALVPERCKMFVSTFNGYGRMIVITDVPANGARQFGVGKVDSRPLKPWKQIFEDTLSAGKLGMIKPDYPMKTHVEAGLASMADLASLTQDELHERIEGGYFDSPAMTECVRLYGDNIVYVLARHYVSSTYAKTKGELIIPIEWLNVHSPSIVKPKVDYSHH